MSGTEESSTLLIELKNPAVGAMAQGELERYLLNIGSSAKVCKTRDFFDYLIGDRKPFPDVIVLDDAGKIDRLRKNLSKKKSAAATVPVIFMHYDGESIPDDKNLIPLSFEALTHLNDQPAPAKFKPLLERVKSVLGELIVPRDTLFPAADTTIPIAPRGFGLD